MKVPAHFDLEREPDAFLEWFNRALDGSNRAIRVSHKRRGKPAKRLRVAAYHDFTSIERMTPSAALVVAALFDRHRQLAGMPIQVYEYERWHPAVRRVLAEVGFFDLLDLPPGKPLQLDPGPEHAKIERFASGSQLSPDETGRLVNTLLTYMASANPDSFSTNEAAARTASLFSALIEATENTRSHAYPQDMHGGYLVLPNWWLTGWVNPAERRLILVVYDQGISMPGSLASKRASNWPGHHVVNSIVRRFSRGSYGEDDFLTDHAKIRLAMKMGQSSTGEAHRGKGLPVVREAIKHCAHGRLHILSRYGAYLEEAGKRGVSWQLRSPMPGTLIIWDLTL